MRRPARRRVSVGRSIGVAEHHVRHRADATQRDPLRRGRVHRSRSCCVPGARARTQSTTGSRRRPRAARSTPPRNAGSPRRTTPARIDAQHRATRTRHRDAQKRRVDGTRKRRDRARALQMYEERADAARTRVIGDNALDSAAAPQLIDHANAKSDAAIDELDRVGRRPAARSATSSSTPQRATARHGA